MKRILKPINENPTPPYVDGDIFYVCPLTGDNRTLVFPNDSLLDIQDHLKWQITENAC